MNLWPIGNCQVSALVDRAGRLRLGLRAAGRRRSRCSARCSAATQPATAATGRSSSRTGRRSSSAISATRRSWSRAIPTPMPATRSRSIDFCPRFERDGRIYRPVAFVRIVRPLAGAPRITRRAAIRLPTGAEPTRSSTSGSNHIRFLIEPTAAAAHHRRAGQPSARGAQLPARAAAAFLPRAGRELRRRCSPRRSTAMLDADHRRMAGTGCAASPSRSNGRRSVIRAAITLKLCQHEETGAIVAALTTSIPEACRIGAQLGLSLLLDPRRLLHGAGAQPARRARRARRLSRLSAQHRRRRAQGGHIQPLYGVSGEATLEERIATGLARLSRHGPGARRQPGLSSRSSTTPTARSSCPTSRPSSTSGCSAWRRREDFASARTGRRARLGDATTSPTPACGNCARDRRVHTYSRGDVLGGLRPARQCRATRSA